jgi:hypothetical protein
LSRLVVVSSQKYTKFSYKGHLQMQMKLSEIIRVDFDVTRKILAVQSSLVKYNGLEYWPLLNLKEAYNSMKQLNLCNILIKFFRFLNIRVKCVE